MFVKAVLGRMNTDFLKVSSRYVYHQVDVPVTCTCLSVSHDSQKKKRHCFLLTSRWVFVTEGFCYLCAINVIMYNVLILVPRALNSHVGLAVGKLFETF